MAKSITYLPMMGVYANSCSGYKLVIGYGIRPTIKTIFYLKNRII